MGSDKHFLLPLGKLNIKRASSGSNSQLFVKSILEHPEQKLIEKEVIERKNTPGESIFKKRRSSKFISPPRRIDSKKQKAVKVQKKVQKKVKRNKKDFGIDSHHLRDKNTMKFRMTVTQLIRKGESDKLADFLSKVNMQLDFTDSDGNTPFNIAAQNGYHQSMNILIKAGVYLDTQNNKGNTPLHYACTYKFPKVLDLLIKNGADQNITNNKGNSPWEGI